MPVILTYRGDVSRFVIDAGTALRIVTEGTRVAPGHELLAPTLWRSQVLATLHEAVAHGDLAADVALARLDAVGRLPVRLLGDAVLRRNAWKVADALGHASTYDAEYVALTKLQGDALVTADPELARAAATLVRVAPFEELTAG
jgi:predicted nucleic acid-binding protein